VIYRAIFNLVFRKLDPEFAHHLVAHALALASRFGLLRAGVRPTRVTAMGLEFENHLGMAAGFDKDAKLIRPLHALGFGHVEIGTVTSMAQPGNPKPRMFRLVDQRALINRMGFNNEGAVKVAKRLKRLRESGKRLPVIGVNIGKSKVIAPDQAAEDYRITTRILARYADYLAVNVSSPNTPGLRDLQQVAALRPILQAVLAEAGETPVLVKLAPDLADADLSEVLGLVRELGLSGVIAANTTIRRDIEGDAKLLAETGGLSGPMLNDRAVEMLKLIRSELDASYTVISVGGIETRQQVAERVSLGADLVQAYTGFVYGGPSWPKRLTAS
jgi:dihydroorotate dehydrogenase